MEKISSLSSLEIRNNLKLKANKIKNNRKNNISSFVRINSYNNQKLFSWLYKKSRNKLKEKPKLFSLLDINDKITNSKGTSFPKQYRRLTEDEKQKLFGDFSRYNNINNIKKKLINKRAENIFTENENEDKFIFKKNNYPQKNYKINNSEISKNNEKDKIKDKEVGINDKNKENEIFNSKKNPLKLKKTIIIKSPEEIIKNDKKLKEKEKNKENKKRDRWLPFGYESYELLIKHPKLFNKKLNAEYSMKKNLSAQIIKERTYNSDIFFFKPPSEKEVAHKTIEKTRNHQNSDIFNIKNDTINISKSGETYLFKKLNKNKYYVTNESNSHWILPNNKMKSLIGSSSKDYNILDPKSKGIYLSKEKQMSECENKKNNSEIVINPTYKQKGITEFVDITRNGACNTRKDYINAYNNNPRCFFKNNQIGSSFYDIYFQYKGLCKKPFVKKNFFD